MPRLREVRQAERGLCLGPRVSSPSGPHAPTEDGGGLCWPDQSGGVERRPGGGRVQWSVRNISQQVPRSHQVRRHVKATDRPRRYQNYFGELNPELQIYLTDS